MALGFSLRKRSAFCPYCYADLQLRSLAFQCSGQAAPGRRECIPHPDPRRQEVLQDSRPVMPPVLQRTPNGQHILDADRMPLLALGPLGSVVTCDRCAGRTAISICPNCHSLLPDELRGGGVSIGVVGARNSGKTVWLTMLDQQLLTQLPQRFHAAIDHPGGTVGLAGQLDENHQRMERHRTLPHQTTSTGSRKKAPSVYRWKFVNGGERVISVYDTAGEDVANRGVAISQQHLRSSDAIVLVLDPFSFPENRAKAAQRQIDPGPANAQADVLDGLVTVLRQSEQGRGRTGKQGRISTPLAVVIPKMDAFRSELDEHSPLRRHGENPPYFDDVDSQTVHDHLLGLLDRWGGASITNKLQTEFENFRVFGISALGNEPDYSQGGLNAVLSPSRVADPLLWVLQGGGFLPQPPRAPGR